MKRRLIAGLCVAAGVIGACVIAEPPADLPSAPAIRPTILRLSAQPSPTGILTRWPARFYVPVQLSDARKSFFASYFVDYNPLANEGYIDFIQSTPSPGDTSTIRLLPIQITEPSREGCHIVEVVVAENFQNLTGSRADLAHTPLTSDDGDTISWIYSPNGDPLGCPMVDAGLLPDAAVLDELDGSADAGPP